MRYARAYRRHSAQTFELSDFMEMFTSVFTAMGPKSRRRHGKRGEDFMFVVEVEEPDESELVEEFMAEHTHLIAGLLGCSPALLWQGERSNVG